MLFDGKVNGTCYVRRPEKVGNKVYFVIPNTNSISTVSRPVDCNLKEEFFLQAAPNTC